MCLSSFIEVNNAAIEKMRQMIATLKSVGSTGCVNGITKQVWYCSSFTMENKNHLFDS